MTIDTLNFILKESYNKDTTHIRYQKCWSQNNPTAGHCAIVSMIVQDYFGGEIYKIKSQHHYYNLIDGNIIDLTKDQYNPVTPNYCEGIKTNRPQGRDCIRRYQLLYNRILNLT